MACVAAVFLDVERGGEVGLGGHCFWDLRRTRFGPPEPTQKDRCPVHLNSAPRQVYRGLCV